LGACAFIFFRWLIGGEVSAIETEKPPTIRFSYDTLDQRATLAQLVERLIRNQQVAGSIPAGGSSMKPTPP
jgi:hypothetical protein